MDPFIFVLSIIFLAIGSYILLIAIDLYSVLLAFVASLWFGLGFVLMFLAIPPTPAEQTFETKCHDAGGVVLEDQCLKADNIERLNIE